MCLFKGRIGAFLEDSSYQSAKRFKEQKRGQNIRGKVSKKEKEIRCCEWSKEVAHLIHFLHADINH